MVRNPRNGLSKARFNVLSFHYGWEYGRGQTWQQELAEIRSAQGSGVEVQYMQCQLYARQRGLVQYSGVSKNERTRGLV